MTRDWREELIEQVMVADRAELDRLPTTHLEQIAALLPHAREELLEQIADARLNGADNA
jgi:hypothetical protein